MSYFYLTKIDFLKSKKWGVFFSYNEPLFHLFLRSGDAS